jgi:hypothetical protein
MPRNAERVRDRRRDRRQRGNAPAAREQGAGE